LLSRWHGTLRNMLLRRLLRLASDHRERERPASLTSMVQGRVRHLSPRRAQFIAAFAGLLARVAYADLDISAAERAVLSRLMAEHAALSVGESEMVTDLVTQAATGLAGIEYAALTRAFNEVASEEEKEQLIDCLYAVATADHTVSVAEDDEIRAVARALLLSHAQLITIRHRYKDQLAVIQAARALQSVR
jgi:uncharacterized tellurite resistance protein B-like protein